MIRRCTAPLLLIGVLIVTSAHADDTRSIDVAKKSYELGQQQYKSNDLEGARLSFAQSFAAWPAVETLRALAIAELDTAHFLDALKHFKAYTKDKNADPEFLKKVPNFIARCNEHVGHIRVDAPVGATLLLDGRRVFDLREPLDVLPGSHTVALREPGPPETRTENVIASQTIDVIFARAAATTSANAPAVSSVPQGDVPPASSEGFWTRRHILMVGLGAAALTSVAVGTGFGVAANSKRTTYDDLKGGRDDFCATASKAACDELLSTASTQRTDGRISNIAFVAAGVFALGVGVVWAWPKADERRSSGLWIAPAVGQGTGGVLAGGRF